MNTKKHTPGPWRWAYRQIDHGGGVVKTAAVMLETQGCGGDESYPHSTIMAVRDDWLGWMNNDVSAGDRAVIAAAPELLDALRACADTLRMQKIYHKGKSPWCQRDDDALAAAESAIEKTMK